MKNYTVSTFASFTLIASSSSAIFFFFCSSASFFYLLLLAQFHLLTPQLYLFSFLFSIDFLPINLLTVFFPALPCANSFMCCLFHFLFHQIQMVLMVNLLILRAMVYFGFHKSSCNLQACPLFAILRIFSLFLHHLLLLLQLRFNH